jgi:hypothetical protein
MSRLCVTSFIKLGATAVIAPLWSVEDDVAREIASNFYGKLKEDPKAPIAQIFAATREKAYEPGLPYRFTDCDEDARPNLRAHRLQI